MHGGGSGCDRILIVGNNNKDVAALENCLPTDLSVDRIDSCASAPGRLIQNQYHAVFVVGESDQPRYREAIRMVTRFRVTTPIILISDKSQQELQRCALKSGFDDCIWFQEQTPAVVARTLRYALEKRRVRKDLSRLAKFDALTGTANRRFFYDYLTSVLTYRRPNQNLATQRKTEEHRRSSPGVALMVLDLDEFKSVNDKLGHPIGDAVLVSTARALRQHARVGDVIARLGGDEFAIILTSAMSREEIEKCASRLIFGISEAMPQQVKNNSNIKLSASIGVAIARPDDDPTELFRRADTALYHSKTSGKNTWSFYDPTVDREKQEKEHLRTALVSAIEHRELTLKFQPIVHSKSGRLASVEALSRWNYADRGAVPPSIFIAMAEQDYQIWNLGRWALEEACRCSQSWRDQGCDVPVSVNVSPLQLQDERFEVLVQNIRDRFEIPRQGLQLEITESVMMGDPSSICAKLKRLRDAGVTIAIDDFGTGFSSLTYLRNLPIQTLKLDGSFVRGGGETNEILIQTMTQLGKKLGYQIVAEGIETQQQQHLATSLECDYLQGFHIGKPLDAHQIPGLISVR